MKPLDTVIRETLAGLLHELVAGPPGSFAYVLNPGDRGLLASLDELSAETASARPGGRSSVAAHVEHLRYGLELLNRWTRGEDPWSTANYAASWRRQEVTEDAWRELRAQLREEAQAWARAAADLRDLSEVGLSGSFGSVVHLAYHLGAIRQLSAATRGPAASD